MKLVNKNGYIFATGMFWQIPDEGKRNVHIAKLANDTRYNMFCQIKTINPTWGFCYKEEMHSSKKVASLGKFIVEASQLSASYANSIICFKFKNAGDLDDGGKLLDNDLYGYIVLLNGTICPEDGEYVSDFVSVRESIIQKAKRHEIDTLYLPFEVAGQLFSIFQILTDALQNDELLLKVMHNLSTSQRNDLKAFINQNLSGNHSYQKLLNDPFSSDIGILRQLIQVEAFEQKLKLTQEQNIKYLIPNIFTLTLTSDEIYWQEPKLKNQFKKSLIGPVSRYINQKYRFGLLFCLIGVSGYLGYAVITDKELPIRHHQFPKPIMPKPISILPIKLIDACLTENDRFFKDLGTWTFTALKCNSLGAMLTFNSEVDTTLGNFTRLIGKNIGNIKLNSRVGTYSIAYKINAISKVNVERDQIMNQLQQSSIDYGFKLTIPQGTSNGFTKNNKVKVVGKFSITSKQSPVFLFNHQVFDNVKLSEISMNLDKASGFYAWKVQGEF